MGLFDRISARPDPSKPGAKPGGYDFVEIPTPEGEVKRLSKSQFEAQPLTERIGVLVGGSARFFRAGQIVPSSEALKSDY